MQRKVYMRRILKIKAIITTLLFVSFIIVLATGILLHIKMSASHNVPIGLKLHIIFCYTMGLLVLLHLIFNIRLYVSELKCLLFNKCELSLIDANFDRKNE